MLSLGHGLGFMLPECAHGQPYDHRSEIYAVAATLYLAITGIRPSDEPTVGGPMVDVLRRAPRTLEELGFDVDPALGAIVMKGLAPNPAERFASVWEMKFELESWLDEYWEQGQEAMRLFRAGAFRVGRRGWHPVQSSIAFILVPRRRARARAVLARRLVRRRGR